VTLRIGTAVREVSQYSTNGSQPRDSKWMDQYRDTIRPGSRRLWLVAALAFGIGTGVCVKAAATRSVWQIGLARKQITPKTPIRLDGYAARQGPSTGVIHDIHAKALALQDQNGHRALLITADVIGFPAHVSRELCRRIMARTGLSRAQILINPSHTHTGPTIWLSADGRIPKDENIAVFARYTNTLCDRLAELAAAAFANLEPAHLSWATGKIHFAVNRREHGTRGVRMGVNEDGYVDRTVPVLSITAIDGRPRGVVFGCACHNTTLMPKHTEICGDYAGFAQEELERTHVGAQAQFIIGCAGSTNPRPRGTVEAARQHGKALAAEVSRVLSADLKPISGPLCTELAWVDLPLAPALPREELERQARGRGSLAAVARKTLAAVDAGKELLTSYPAPIAVWQLGKDMTLVGLSGEVVAEFVPRVQGVLGPERLWIAGYCNEVFGYLATASILREGGYETRGLFHKIGAIAPEAEDGVIQALCELARKAGRPECTDAKPKQ
jgi:neutral ceramidase